jgi:glycosyltransferase involved in cell wall biosynthesis
MIEKISVVIPCYNVEQTIVKCLKALKKQSYNSYEVLLVDNGSTDSSVSLIKEFIKKNKVKNFFLFKLKEKGSCRARNFGIKKATGEIIVNIDADCLPKNDYLQEIEKSYTSEEIGGVAGNIVAYSFSTSVERFLALYTLRGLPESTIFTEYNLIGGGFATANLSFTKRIWERIGGFDEKLPCGRYGEDHDICARIYKEGYKIRYNKNAVVYHIHRTTIRAMLKQSFVFGFAQTLMLKKHFKNIILLDLPQKNIIYRKLPGKCWIDLNLADKKMIFLFLLAIFSRYFLLLPLFYFLWLMRNVSKKAQSNKVRLHFFDIFLLPSYLIMKSLFMSMGRIYGSIKFKVLCL